MYYWLIVSLSAIKGRRVCRLSMRHFPFDHVDRLASRSSLVHGSIDLVSTDWCIVYSCVWSDPISIVGGLWALVDARLLVQYCAYVSL
jgi:hypothetical protein